MDHLWLSFMMSSSISITIKIKTLCLKLILGQLKPSCVFIWF